MPKDKCCKSGEWRYSTKVVIRYCKFFQEKVARELKLQVRFF